MAVDTLNALKERLADISGDSTSGFWSTANQTRALNFNLRRLYRENWYETVLRYSFSSVADQINYTITVAQVPRLGEFDHLEYWEDPTTDTEPSTIYEYNKPGTFTAKLTQNPIFTYQNYGATTGNTVIRLSPPISTVVTNGLVLQYFPKPVELDDSSPAVADPLLTAYEPAAEILAQWTAADMRKQEGAFDEASAFETDGNMLLDKMRQDMPRKVKQERKQIRMVKY